MIWFVAVEERRAPEVGGHYQSNNIPLWSPSSYRWWGIRSGNTLRNRRIIRARKYLVYLGNYIVANVTVETMRPLFERKPVQMGTRPKDFKDHPSRGKQNGCWKQVPTRRENPLALAVPDCCIFFSDKIRNVSSAKAHKHLTKLQYCRLYFCLALYPFEKDWKKGCLRTAGFAASSAWLFPCIIHFSKLSWCGKMSRRALTFVMWCALLGPRVTNIPVKQDPKCRCDLKSDKVNDYKRRPECIWNHRQRLDSHCKGGYVWTIRPCNWNARPPGPPLNQSHWMPSHKDVTQRLPIH